MGYLLKPKTLNHSRREDKERGLVETDWRWRKGKIREFERRADLETCLEKLYRNLLWAREKAQQL